MIDNIVIPSEVEGSALFRQKDTVKIPPRGFALVGMTAFVGFLNRTINRNLCGLVSIIMSKNLWY